MASNDSDTFPHDDDGLSSHRSPADRFLLNPCQIRQVNQAKVSFDGKLASLEGSGIREASSTTVAIGTSWSSGAL